MEHLAPLAPVMRPLGNRYQGHILDSQLLQRVAHRAHLALAAIDQHQVGPHAVLAFRIFLQRAGKAALHDLAHHAEVVVGPGGADVELAVLVLDEAFGAGNDHRAHGLGALDVAVVVNLDPARHLGQFEELGQFAQGSRLGTAFGQSPVERLHGVAAGLLHQPPPVATLGDGDLDLPAGQFGQRLFQQVAVGQRAVDQDRARRRHFLVELHQDAGQHLVLGHVLRVGGEEGAVAPVLPAAHEETLHRNLPALGSQRKDIGIAHAFGVYRLGTLDEGRRAQPVAQHGGCLEIQRLCRLGHLPLDLALDRIALARKELLRLAQQLVIAGLVDPADTGGRAALDLVQQARPVAPGKEAVGAAAQQEQLLQGIDRGVDAAGAGEGSVIGARSLARAAVLHDAREVVPFAQQDEGEAFVVAQQHVVGRAEALDELRFQQQRLGFGIGGDDLHAARLADHALQPVGEAGHLGIIRHPVLQRPRLANVQHIAPRIEHAVDAGQRIEGPDHLSDRLHPRRQIRLR